jgi:adenine-specific DNA-methyltransferase
MVAGPGRALRADAFDAAEELGPFDLAYLDPPYNQHRYFTNYHIWETLVAWDAPSHYGVACKREDARDPATKSVFNDRRRMPEALAAVIAKIDAAVVIVSYNDESWIAIDDLEAMAATRGQVVTLAFAAKRYVGAQIGIHNPQGEKVGSVSHTRNQEYVLVAGDAARVARTVAPLARYARVPAGRVNPGH